MANPEKPTTGTADADSSADKKQNPEKRQISAIEEVLEDVRGYLDEDIKEVMPSSGRQNWRKFVMN